MSKKLEHFPTKNGNKQDVDRNLSLPMQTSNERQKCSQKEKRNVTLLGWDPPLLCVWGARGGERGLKESTSQMSVRANIPQYKTSKD